MLISLWVRLLAGSSRQVSRLRYPEESNRTRYFCEFSTNQAGNGNFGTSVSGLRRSQGLELEKIDPGTFNRTRFRTAKWRFEF